MQFDEFSVFDCIKNRHLLMSSIQGRADVDRIERALLPNSSILNPKRKERPSARTVFNSLVYAFEMSRDMSLKQLHVLWKNLLIELFEYPRDAVAFRQNDFKLMVVNSSRNTTFVKNHVLCELEVYRDNDKLFSVEIAPYSTDSRLILSTVESNLKVARQHIKLLILDKIYLFDSSNLNAVEINFKRDNPLGIDFAKLFCFSDFDSVEANAFIMGQKTSA